MKNQIFYRALLCLLAVVLAGGLSIAPAGVVWADSPPARPGAASPDLDQTVPDDSAAAQTAETLLQSTALAAESTSGSCAVFQAGGDRLSALQNDDGGWDWPLDNGDPTNSSPPNTIGPIAMGLGHAYLHSNDPDHVAALQQAGAFLLNKTNNFSPSDGYLAAQLDDILGGTTYVDYVTANFYGPLAAGAYDRGGYGTLYSTATYVNLIRTARAAQGIANLAAWDIGMGLVGAASAGADTAPWIAGVKAEIDELDGSAYYDVIGLTGAVYGLAFVGEDFDPTAGQHAAAGSLGDLAGILAGYQIDGGGFTWNMAYLTPGNETIQETAYALLALNQVDRALYLNAIQGATSYMESVQLATGGWENYVGSSSGENNEITGEALWGISVGLPGPLASQVAADPNPAPLGSAVSLQALVDNTAGCAAIASAEYSLDGGAWAAMAAQDGAFDEVGEGVTADLGTWSEPGIYTYSVCVRGTDVIGNTGPAECVALMLVVYDPDGGFVTGGGWIDSPEGAYHPDMYPSGENFFLDTFDVDPPLSDTAVDGAWYKDRYLPAAFESVDFDGDKRLHVAISADDYLPHGSTFYNYQGRKFNLWNDLDTYITADLYVGADWETEQRHASLWATTYDADGIISGYPIAGFTAGKGFRIFTQDTDQDPSNDYQPGWYDIGYPNDFGYGQWYTMRAELTRTAYRYYINGELVWTDIATYDSVLWANMMLQAYNYGEDYDVYWDNVGAGRIGEFPVGKATFGFVSKYNKKTKEPEGNTEFQFKAADLSFRSASYDWLVVTGGYYARYKGEGTINGEAAPNGTSYKFMIWAGDGTSTNGEDTFRIKIWWEEGVTERVVYDNGMDQELGGGSIVVHTKK